MAHHIDIFESYDYTDWGQTYPLRQDGGCYQAQAVTSFCLSPLFVHELLIHSWNCFLALTLALFIFISSFLISYCPLTRIVFLIFMAIYVEFTWDVIVLKRRLPSCLVPFSSDDAFPTCGLISPTAIVPRLAGCRTRWRDRGRHTSLLRHGCNLEHAIGRKRNFIWSIYVSLI